MRARNRRVSTAALERSSSRGDFGGGVAHQDLQHQRLAVLVGQFEQGGAHFGEVLLLGGGQHRLFPATSSSTSTVTNRLRSKLRAYSRRMMVKNQGLAARLVQQRVLRLPGTQHGFLHHVLGQSAVAGQPERETQEIRAQGLAQRLEAGALLISANLILHV